ncbi:MAG: hypothetical protein ACR2JD_08365 [Nocardioides sp.]
MSPRRTREPSRLDADGLAALITGQDGVVSRRQVLQLGGTDRDIARRLHSRDWTRVHPGVYLDHTGAPTWDQRAWAAVLARWPAALGGASAVRAHGLRGGRADDAAPIHIVIPGTRSVDPLPGARIERIRDFDRVAHLNLHPPRARLEHALLKTAASLDEDGAVGVLADACQQRRTTAARLVPALTPLSRLRHRALLLEILCDVASGAFPVLERRYLRDVERAHGLPGDGRQRPAKVGRARTFCDVEYVEQLIVVELDGRLGHEWTADRWADLDRDLAAAEEALMTVRVGWHQVLSPCRLAGAVGRILVARGWTGAPVTCSPGCSVRR